MPELPDIETYLFALRKRLVGQELKNVRIASPFLLRSVEPKLETAFGKKVREFERLGKRIVFVLEGDLYLVLHLMIAGRFRWGAPEAKIPGKLGLAAFDFDNGTLLLTEASKKKRASLMLVHGETALRTLNPGGAEPFEITFDAFESLLKAENHTLKRSLTDPRILSGIGNAYSDEILHRAKLSPVLLTSRLTTEQTGRLFEAMKEVLTEWKERLIAQLATDFPKKVTAFRPEMAVHGRFGQPCPVCGDHVQRIVFKDRETNYCATCQTGGRLLADRALSRLLKQDWPRSLEAMEELKGR